MFVLAHLSDVHLAPLPVPNPLELASKRGLGFLNWLRKRHRIHRREVLDAIVGDLKAQNSDHVAFTGDLVNLSLTSEFPRSRQWLEALGTPDRVTFVPGNHDTYVRAVLGKVVFDTVIPRDVAVSEAPSHGQSVLDYSPRARGARAYVELCMEVLERD